MTNTSPHLNTHTHPPTEHLNKHRYLWAAVPVNQGEWSSLRVTDKGSWCSLPAQSWTETCTPLQVPPCCPWTGSSLDTKWLHVTEPVRISLCRLSHLLATVASLSVCCRFCSASRDHMMSCLRQRQQHVNKLPLQSVLFPPLADAPCCNPNCWQSFRSAAFSVLNGWKRYSAVSVLD